MRNEISQSNDDGVSSYILFFTEKLTFRKKIPKKTFNLDSAVLKNLNTKNY
ncbi:hypothetical protein LEP1GSC132_2265 [Leptospira kirschneri str. 200803703]|nr:hypothetical protein LEP1GSC044_0795 [Leptospira kirschneri serovar Grippotyphosa str. RM52]EKP05461.1 hypothetical protein LEP1GSC018_1467 [Leptospira kirschneri str. 2008720114]EKQ83102.1 hypothetical protein LEP1GSC064_1231 [Leptospira kirschneri serovar Grippotyphosa str. Moskva]EMJ92032.1 hypothetical protein LEP1GSC198_0381 [Leptospira kirschneri str. JB]EMK00724.1 hypothetical protein LEP1GSC176_0751 [Leptospira kirschneri str. MMD1493]EMK09087.1 hypothetical protein LEP1GSC166_0982 